MKQVLILIIILGCGYWIYNRYFKVANRGDLVKMKIGKKELWVETRETPAERRQGLSGRESLADNEGMLFIFEKPGNYGFWMSGMKFDLDFVFIKGNKVVEIKEAVPAPKGGAEAAVIKPAELTEMVLEVNSGWIKEHDVEVGDKVSFL